MHNVIFKNANDCDLVVTQTDEIVTKLKMNCQSEIISNAWFSWSVRIIVL